MSDPDTPRTRIVVVGLGGAGMSMLARLRRRRDFELVAVVDVDGEARELARAGAPGAASCTSLEEACAAAAPELAYVATPTSMHCEHTVEALGLGLHVLVEKPVAVSLSEADSMASAARAAGRQILVCHKRSVDPGIRKIREIVTSGDVGSVRTITLLHYSDWLARPREAHDLDPLRGGGVVLRQGSHHFDIVRALGGGIVTGLSARTYPAVNHPGHEGGYRAHLEFANGVDAFVLFSGQDHFNTVELNFQVDINGTLRSEPPSSRSRGRSDAAGQSASQRKRTMQRRAVDGAAPRAVAQPIYGFLLVSCDRADLRLSPEGVLRYSSGGRDEVPVDLDHDGLAWILDECRDASARDRRAPHGMAWGMANLEVCLAVRESGGRGGARVELERQVELD